MAKKTLLVDGDILLYKCGFSAEQSIEWDEDIWSSKANLSKAQAHADEWLTKLTEEFKADILIVLSDKANWRKELDPSYKANRKKNRKPLLIQPLREYLEENYETMSRPRLEADDILGILQTSGKIVKGKTMICSIDKDLLQIPGFHYNLDSQEKTKVTLEEGKRLHMIQTLSGDPVDNYPGCPGIGSKRAAKIVDGGIKVTPFEHEFKSGPRKGQVETRFREEEGHDVWEAIVSWYEKNGLTEEAAILQARLAHILTADDYDFKKKEVILWTPSCSS